jgi:hypothetical protein
MICIQIELGTEPLVFKSHLVLTIEELEFMLESDIDAKILERYNSWLSAINSASEVEE